MVALVVCEYMLGRWEQCMTKGGRGSAVDRFVERLAGSKPVLNTYPQPAEIGYTIKPHTATTA